MVVCLHTTYPEGLLGGAIRTISRAGVPFFFMVSGYYGWHEEVVPRSKRIKALKKHVVIWLGVCAVYFLVSSIPDLLHQQFPEVIKESLFSPKWLVSNFGFVGHMWFMRALIYLDVFLIVLEKHIHKLNLKWLLLFIWLLDVVVFKYSDALFSFVVPQPINEIITKYLCNAFLFYFAGYYMHSKEHSIVPLVQKAGMALQIVAVLLFSIVSVFEYILLEHYSVNTMPVNYIFTMPLSVGLFLFGISNSKLGENRVFTWIGLNFSMYVYYWHPLIIKIVKRIASGNLMPYVNNPITIFIISLLAGCCIFVAKKQLSLWSSSRPRKS